MRFLRDNPGETEDKNQKIKTKRQKPKDKNQKTKTKRPLAKSSVRRSGYEYGF